MNIKEGERRREIENFKSDLAGNIYHDLPAHTGDLHHSRITDQQTHQSSDFLLPTHHREDIKQNLHI